MSRPDQEKQTCKTPLEKALYVSVMCSVVAVSTYVFAEDHTNDKWMSSATFNGVKFRIIGSACNSGRIADVEMNPTDSSTGTTWSPLVDSQSVYSIATVTLAPQKNLSGRSRAKATAVIT